MVFQPSQRTGEPQPGADGNEEDSSAMGDAKAGSAHPAPAENETGSQHDEPTHDENGKEGVEQGDEIGERQSGLFLARELEDRGAGSRREAELQRLQLIKQRLDRTDPPNLLGIQQNPERSGERDLEGLGHTPRQAVVQNYKASRGFQGEHEDFRFSASQVTDERESRLAGGATDRYPLQATQVGDRETEAVTDRQLFRNGSRDDNPLDQGRKEIKKAELIKVLKSGGVADHLRQGGFPCRNPRR
jgi:hypothetical protein